MQRIKHFFVSTVVGGLVVLAPLSILGFLGAKAAAHLGSVSHAVADSLGIESIWIQILLALAAVGLLVLACFVVGLAVGTRIGNSAYGLLEKVFSRIPLYDLFKRVAAHSAGRGTEDFAPVFLEVAEGVSLPVLLIESGGRDKAVVFVPLSPTPGVGHVLVVDENKITRTGSTLIPVMDALMTWGVGMGEVYKRKGEIR